jgi:hypothetical protein
MPAIIEPQGPGEEGGPVWRKLAWFAAIALASAAATVTAAYLLRAVLFL